MGEEKTEINITHKRHERHAQIANAAVEILRKTLQLVTGHFRRRLSVRVCVITHGAYVCVRMHVCGLYLHNQRAP